MSMREVAVFRTTYKQNTLVLKRTLMSQMRLGIMMWATGYRSYYCTTNARYPFICIAYLRGRIQSNKLCRG